MKALTLFAAAALLALTSIEAKADQILVLSGGGAPSSNHYSQYLQTKTLTDNLRTMLPKTDVNVFFGAGNADGVAPVLADVHRVVKSGGVSREVLESGFIAQNKAATHQNIDLYFRDLKITSMAKDETFFMLVSDHGMPFTNPDGTSDRTYSNNCINLWAFNADITKNSFSTGTPADNCFSKDALKNQLFTNVPAKRSVFAMSQCYSGGFHKMSVDLTKSYPTADARICGFTAVTEDTTASGCTPDVDGPNYQGYERSFTEQLTGVDVVSGKRLRPAKISFSEAHQAATVEDFAKDIPLATSDFYLWKWALAIENNTFVPRTSVLKADAARKLVIETVVGKQNLKDAAYAEKELFYSRMQNEFLRLYPEYAREFGGMLDGHKALEQKLSSDLSTLEKSMWQLGGDLSQNTAALLQAWNQRVATNPAPLTFDEARIETEFFGRIEAKFGAGSGNQISLLLMSMKTITDPARAKSISEYGAKRFPYATDWAAKSGDKRLIDFAAQRAQQQKQMDEISAKYDVLQKRQGHVRRLMIYREALGAWSALAQMGDTQALGELKALLECESATLR